MTTQQRTTPSLAETLPAVVDAVRTAGAGLLEVYSPDARPRGRDDIDAAATRNEEVSTRLLRSALIAARPDARWVKDDQETTPLDTGAWWVIDAAEGSVNHIHGMPEWGVTATLIENHVPVLAAAYQPIGDHTWTAIRGAGARHNDLPLRISSKTELSWSIATTGQAEARQDTTYRQIGDSITAMLGNAMLVRATVPSTFPLLMVAEGHAEVFWQYEPVLPGVALGALLVTEAGGIISDTDGQPWRPGSPTFLAAAPGVHAEAVRVLSTLGRS
jgi:myo-inositol-1(or 4)-monophosphatase